MKLRFLFESQAEEEALTATEKEINKEGGAFRQLYKAAPEELKKIIISQWYAKQNPKHHPEGNTLKHIITVVNRAAKHFPENKDLLLSAFFHDLGKMKTYELNPKTGQPTAYGHEKESAILVDEYASFIEGQGANVDNVKHIVTYHMKIKPSVWSGTAESGAMAKNKKLQIQKHDAWSDLRKFARLDKGGTHMNLAPESDMPEPVEEQRRLHIINRFLNLFERRYRGKFF